MTGVEQELLLTEEARAKALKEKRDEDFRARQRDLNDLRIVMSSREGRRFLWRLMGHCKVFGSVMDQDGRIQYNAGQQDVGHFIMAEIIEADPNRYPEMMRESRKEATAKEGKHV